MRLFTRLSMRSAIAASFLVATSCLLGGIGAAHAQDSAPLETACANKPERCAEIRTKLQAQCAADPAACEQKKAQLQERAAKLKAKCDADPEACAEKKAKFQQRAAEFKAKCAADPAACEEKKAKWRERFQQRSAQ